MFVDSHCHLDRLDLTGHNNSLDEALNAARAKGVHGFLCVGIGFENAESLLALERKHPDVWLSMGVHPLDQDLSVDEATLRRWCSLPQVQAVGETGLDYHYQPETRSQQIESFELHLRMAAELEKPVIVHTREAQDDTLSLIREHGGRAGGVLHCFTESWEMAEQALELGYYISLSGIVTFKNAEALRKVAATVPLDRLLIETDSPYLAPVPKRGKPNDSSLLPYVAECIASERGMDIKELALATTENFHRLFPNTLCETTESLAKVIN